MKKLISLFLTLALLSTMFVIGTTTASAAVATTTVTDGPVNPDILYVAQSTANSVTTQTVTALTSGTKSMNYYKNQWAYMRFPIGDFESISSATLGVYIKCDNAGYLYVLPTTKTEWDKASAVAAKASTSENVLSTANNDKMLETFTSIDTSPANNSEKIDASQVKSYAGTYDSETDTWTQGSSNGMAARINMTGENLAIQYSYNSNKTKRLQYDNYGGSLVSYLNSAVSAQPQPEYVYFAVTYQTGSNKTGSTLYAPSYHRLTLTGERTAFSDAEITWNDETDTCTIATTTTTGTAKLIVASFNGATMNDAKVVEIDAATDAAEGVITKTIADLADGTVKIFLWDSTTLAPTIGVTTPSAAE